MIKANEYITKGEKYLCDCVFDGLAHSYDVVTKEYVKPYPEVTGYVIKYVCDNFEVIPRNIIKAANKLVKLQDKKSGGYASFFEERMLFAFDTSQILIGLLAIYKRTGKRKYLNAAVKAGDFLLHMQLENGAIVPMYDRKTEERFIQQKTYDIWNGPWSGLNCKLTEGFAALYDATGDEKYKEALKKTADFYEQAQYIECTHPLGYWLEGLYAAGRFDKVREVLEQKVIPRIRGNGYIAYKEELDYAYVSGVVQLGILLAKLGYQKEAKIIRNYGRTVQTNHSSGGLFQYADCDGALDYHVHTEINSWGTKYFCELERLLMEED